MKKQQSFFYEVYISADDLNQQDAALLLAAKQATAAAYAPYSNFHVAAAARLKDGTIITGTNQENASYPVGICAERVLLASVASLYNTPVIDTIAICYDNKAGESNKPVAPCGMCRQALTEYEARQLQPIRLILGGMQGEVFIIEQANALLPFGFSSADMK